MLSDQGSQVIRAYGILNTNIPKSLPLYGIPFPGQRVEAVGKKFNPLPHQAEGRCASNQ